MARDVNDIIASLPVIHRRKIEKRACTLIREETQVRLAKKPRVAQKWVSTTKKRG